MDILSLLTMNFIKELIHLMCKVEKMDLIFYIV